MKKQIFTQNKSFPACALIFSNIIVLKSVFCEKKEMNYICGLHTYFKKGVTMDHIVSYSSLDGFVAKDCKPTGRLKKTPLMKGCITIFINQTELMLKGPLQYSYTKSRREHDLKKMFTSHLEDDVQYTFTIHGRKKKHYIFIYHHNNKQISKQFMIQRFDLMIKFWGSIIDHFIRIDKAKFKSRYIEIEYIRIFFEPVLSKKKLVEIINHNTITNNNISLIPSNNNIQVTNNDSIHPNLEKPNLIEINTLLNYKDIKLYHHELMVGCDVIINKILNILTLFKDKKYEKNIFGLFEFDKQQKRKKLSVQKKSEKCKLNLATNTKKKGTHLPQVRHFHSSPNHSVNIYSDLKYFLENNPKNEETQKKIELFLLRHGLNISEEKKDRNIGGIYEGLYSKKVTEFLSEFKLDLIKKIKNLLKFKEQFIEKSQKKSMHKLYLIDIIEMVGTSYVLSILLGRFLRILTNTKYNKTNERNLVLDVALDLSTDLIREYLKVKFKNYRNSLIKEGIIKGEKEYLFSEWKKENLDLFHIFEDASLKVSIGVMLIEWLEDCNLISKKLVKLQKSQHNIYYGNENILNEWENKLKTEVWTATGRSEKLIQEKNVIITNPLRLPSITPPKPFIELGDGKVQLGGYLLNDEEYCEELILPNYSLYKQSIIKNETIIYDVLNKVNSVGYKINIDVLKFVTMNPNLYKGSLINEFHPLEEKVKLTQKEKNELQKHRNKFELQDHIFKIADLFSIVDEFFFINRIDNRGRLYCMGEYLNYQSIELAKALLLFSRPNKLHRLNSDISLLYFKAYGVNCFGNKLEKLSLKDKEKWIETNVENIINYENGVLIQQSENKFMFTAFCNEYKKWFNFYYNSNETYFNTYLPIQLDATCNGFQHLILLSCETDLCEKLNLTEKSYYDKPSDFYSYVLEIYLDYLNSLDFSSLSTDEKDGFERIKDFCLNRKIIKKMIMTIPYNASTKKMVDDLTEILVRIQNKEGDDWFIHPDDVYDNEKRLSYKDLFLLVTSLRNQLDRITPRVTKLKKYLKQIAIICTDLELHIPWLLPIGLEVRQSYLTEKSVNIKPFSYSNSKIKLSLYIKKFDLNKQSRAFMPNLIHSLDATSLMLLLHKYFNNSELNSKNIYTIHDCFAMPMNHVEFIIDTLRKVYISLYSESNYLKELDKCILDNLKHQFRYVDLDRETLKLKVMVGSEEKIYDYPNINEVLGKELVLNPGIPYILV